MGLRILAHQKKGISDRFLIGNTTISPNGSAISLITLKNVQYFDTGFYDCVLERQDLSSIIYRQYVFVHDGSYHTRISLPPIMRVTFKNNLFTCCMQTMITILLSTRLHIAFAWGLAIV